MAQITCRQVRQFPKGSKRVPSIGHLVPVLRKSHLDPLENVAVTGSHCLPGAFWGPNPVVSLVPSSQTRLNHQPTSGNLNPPTRLPNSEHANKSENIYLLKTNFSKPEITHPQKTRCKTQASEFLIIFVRYGERDRMVSQLKCKGSDCCWPSAAAPMISTSQHEGLLKVLT